MKKRVLSMFLMLTMVFSLIVVPASTVNATSFYDTVDLDCELAVDVLSALGIMGGYTDGSFLPYDPITKAEMAAIAVKLSGITEYSDEAPDDMVLFNDMYDYDGWASGVVAIAKTAGIARSDASGNFYPDMSASYEDAVQMVVSALGYGHMAQARGDSLGDYVAVGQRLGITKKLNTAMGQNITRGDVAKLVYAALTVDIMLPITYSADGTDVTYQAVEGKNVLNTYFDVYEVKGIISESEYAAIDGETTVDEKQVLINGEIFNIGSTDIYNYLGYYATVYALENQNISDYKIIISYSVKNVKNNTLKIDAENIQNVDSSIKGYTFSYWIDKENDKKPKKASTSATPLVLYNGKAVDDVSFDLLTPDNGHVVLIDNNGDDAYDIIDIWEYDLVYVFSASQISGNVSGYYDRTRTYKLDAESENYHVTFLNAYGGASKLSDVKQYSILYVYESLDGKEKKVVVSNGKVSGTVEEATSDGYYTINGAEYKISPAVDGMLELTVSDSGDFYLDADNRIAGFEGTTVIRKNIGMFIAVNNGGLRAGYQIKVLTPSSGVKVYDLAASIKVNNSRMTAEEFCELAYTNALFGATTDAGYSSRGIKRPNPARAAFLYKLNADNKVCEVIVVGENDTYLQVRQIKGGESESIYYSTGFHCLHWSGKTETDEFGNTVGVRTYCDNSTVAFFMDESESHTDENVSFNARYMNSFRDNDNFNWARVGIYAYYYSPDGSAIDKQKTVSNFIVVADIYEATEEAGEWVNDPVKYQHNVAPKFVYNITDAYDRNTGENTYRVYYFDGTSLRSGLVRPVYKHVVFHNGELYPNGFPVRIGLDGSYIEDMAPYFSKSYTTMKDMVTPIFNASTNAYVLPFMPFYQEQAMGYNDWSDNQWDRKYKSRFYCGVITSVDEVVGNKLFSLAAATGEYASGEEGERNTYTIEMLSDERLEGGVYRLNLDRNGNLVSLSKGSLNDITPGQLVIVRKRAWNTDANWSALTGYVVNEIYIISDDASSLDYLSDFYKQVQEEIVSAK